MDSLMKVSGAESVTEVIRRALTVYEYVWSVKKKRGAEIIIRERDGTEQKLLVL